MHALLSEVAALQQPVARQGGTMVWLFRHRFGGTRNAVYPNIKYGCGYGRGGVM